MFPRLFLFCNLVPDLSVDPQGSRQGEVGLGAGDPAAHWAGDGADDTLQFGQFLQAGRAERVVAVEHAWDPVSAGVLIAAHDALELFTDEHGDFSNVEDRRGKRTGFR